jgi:N-acetylmuramoyl-L-alanine amidase
VPLNSPIKKGSQDPYVKNVQQQLLALGYSLPRFGADGSLGDETLRAYGEFLVLEGLRAPTDDIPKAISPTGAAALDRATAAIPAPPPGEKFFDERNNHPHDGRSKSMPFRTWSNVTAIVLHQTATQLGEKPERWHSVPIHFGITRAGKTIQLYDLTEVCNHAGNFNRWTVGIEVDGWYAGIEGRPETLWQPKPPAPKRTPMSLPDAQLSAAKACVKRIVDTVAANGGQITHIHPHRQSSGDRQSDPGSLIWQSVGLWAQQQFGLSDGGKKYKIDTGRTIPEAWDARYTGNKY